MVEQGEPSEGGSKRKAGLKLFLTGIALVLGGGVLFIVPRHSEIMNLMENLIGFALVGAGGAIGLVGLLQALIGRDVWAFVTKKH